MSHGGIENGSQDMFVKARGNATLSMDKLMERVKIEIH